VIRRPRTRTRTEGDGGGGSRESPSVAAELGSLEGPAEPTAGGDGAPAGSAPPRTGGLAGLAAARARALAPSQLAASARERPELAALAIVLALGLALRVWLEIVWRPAITGYSDSGIYFEDAFQGVWTDPLRTVGYGMLLAALHWITPHLVFVTIVQHLLGLASAVLMFLTVRAIGGPAWLGVVPAAALALSGDELFVEHAALSEAPYVFLLSVMLYATVRAWRGSWRWALLAGLCAGLGVWDRGAGLSLLPVVPLWLLLCRRRPSRRTLAVAVVSALVAVATVEGYIQWRHAASGLSGLTTNGNWDLYGRVAPWADCTKFSPPAGTEQLCQATPPAQRGNPGAATYIFDASSPAQMLYGPPYQVSPDPYAMSRLWEFSISAIEGQPLDYLNAVWQDTIRLVDPNHPSEGNLSADQFIGFLIGGPDEHSGINTFVSYWQGLEYPHDAVHHGDIAPLRTWEEITRLQGPLMVILLLLTLSAPWTAVGDMRAGARLLALVTVVLLMFPILTTGYDYRYVIPALGPLFASAALGGWGIWARLGGRRQPGEADADAVGAARA